MNNRQMFSKLANIQLELSKLMGIEDVEELKMLAKTDSPNGGLLDALIKAMDSKGIAEKVRIEVLKAPALQIVEEPRPEVIEAAVAKEITEAPKPGLFAKVNTFIGNLIRPYEVAFNKATNGNKTETFVNNKALGDNKAEAFLKGFTAATELEQKKHAEELAKTIEKSVEENKNAAFKYGLGLIALGAMLGAILFPSMKSQLSTIVENGKPVMEKVFAALAALASATLAFLPMVLGALLLWFSFSDKDGGPEKGKMMDKIIQASVLFFQSIENALVGEGSADGAKQEAPKAEETKAIQQRVARLQLELAQIANDLA
jgi:hypothetical protein